MNPPRIIGEVRSIDSWAGLIACFRLAVDARQTTYENIGELAGLPPRYVNKVLSGMRGLNQQSLGPLMGALGVKLLLVDDEEMLATFGRRIIRRKFPKIPDTCDVIPARKRHKRRSLVGNSAWGRMMVNRRTLIRTGPQRKSNAIRAIRIRWAKRKNK